MPVLIWENAVRCRPAQRSLVQRHIFLGEAGGFLFLNARQKTLYRRVTAIEFVIQIREDGEVIAMRL